MKLYKLVLFSITPNLPFLVLDFKNVANLTSYRNPFYVTNKRLLLINETAARKNEKNSARD